MPERRPFSYAYLGGHWFEGVYEHSTGRYWWTAKVFANAVDGSLPETRIPKLMLRQETRSGAIVAHYDSGWDIEPSAEERPVVQEVIEGIMSIELRDFPK